MKVETPQSWVLIIVGNMPPGALPESIAESILSATTVNLPLTQYMKGSTVLATGDSPIECLKKLAGHVTPLVKPSTMQLT